MLQSPSPPIAAAISTPKPTTIPSPTMSPTMSPTLIPTLVPTDALEPTAEPSNTPMAEALDGSVQRYQEPGDYLDSIVASNLERWFIVHIPPQYEPGKPMPMVLNLHGRASTAIQQQDASRMNQKADEEGFIVVYPQALGQPTTWFGVLFGEEGQPDMVFFADLISYLESQISVDPARIYATGISNGATMVNRLGCDMSLVFAAVAPVAGAHSGLHLCEIVQPVSMLALHGTDDQIIPFESSAPDVPSVKTWVEAWAERNGCLGSLRSEQAYEDVLLQSWDDCDDGTAVGLYTVGGGGHTWLGLKYGPSVDVLPEVGATDVIWEFFKAHPKRSVIRALPGERA